MSAAVLPTLVPTGSPATTTLASVAASVSTSAFSNPLYFKTSLVAFLAAWPIAIMCFIVYFYNMANYKNMSATVKMIFFPVLLFPGILDNCYDIITKADVNEYKSTPLAVLIGVYVIASVISLLYLGLYTYDSMNPDKKGMYSRLPTTTDEEQDESGGGGGDVTLGRWQRVIDEYMTANVIWSVTTYNLMIMVIYVARYITHSDGNYMREIDVALVSAVLLGLVIILAIVDFALFKNPANGSVFMHYVVAAVFSLNFTVDFQAQVGFCEIITLGVFFLSVFLAVYKLKLFMELGTPASKKRD
jgi:hypothetical protein